MISDSYVIGNVAMGMRANEPCDSHNHKSTRETIYHAQSDHKRCREWRMRNATNSRFFSSSSSASSPNIIEDDQYESELTANAGAGYIVTATDTAAAAVRKRIH